MAPNTIRLFRIGQRGVDIVNKPQDLDESELASGQNVEIATSAGGGALDQRPGMTRINNATLGGAAAMVLNVESQLLTDLTPYLYAGLYSGATHNWRKSSDGTTWTNDDTPAKPFSNNANILLYSKNYPRAVTVGSKLYWVDSNSPIQLHVYDGVTDTVISTIPSAVTGVNLSTPVVTAANGGASGGGATWTYKVVATNGASYSAASAASSVTNAAQTLDSSNYMIMFPTAPPVAGATAYDVYRTAVGTSPATTGKIGSIPIVSGAFTTGNGSGVGAPGYNFTDAGLVGDASVAPSSASGSTAGNALGVLDMISDGSSIYFAVLDLVGTDPNPVGRILQFFPISALWSQIGLAFPIAAGSGTPAALALFDGAITYGNYIGTTSGNASYVASTGNPLPAGGIPEIHATAASFAPTCMAGFNGELFVGTTCLTTTAAIVLKRTAAAVWSTSLTAGASASRNGYTSLYVFNGRLYAGWTSGGGATTAKIHSTPDGITWTLEKTLAATDVPCQMVTFGGSLYVVCGKTGVSYNTTTSLYQRTTSGTWTQVDDPSDDYAGCLAVVYK